MKLIDKLAKEHGSKRECCCGNCGCGGTAQESAFHAGFRKARDLARSALDDNGVDPTGYADHVISQIGEEEVEP